MFNLLFNILSLRASKAGEDGGLRLKPSLHKTVAHLHRVWECVMHQPIKLIPFFISWSGARPLQWHFYGQSVQCHYVMFYQFLNVVLTVYLQLSTETVV